MTMPWIDLLSPSELMDLALRGSVVSIAASIGYGMARRSSASLRHFVLSSSLIVAVILPLATSRFPGWNLNQFVAVSEPATTDVAEPEATEGAFSSEETSSNEGSPPLRLHDHSFSVAESGPPPRQPERVDAVAEAFDEPQTSSSETVRDGDLSTDWFSTAITWLPIVWLSGFCLALIPTLTGLCGLSRIASRASVITERSEGSSRDDWIVLARQIQAQLSLSRAVRLLSSSSVDVPMTWGIVRPTILLPEDDHDWSEARRRIVLIHEMAHIRRADWVTNMVGELARAIHWFNPMVWFLVRRLHMESEQACDDLVVRTGTNAADYAAELLSFVERVRSASVPQGVLPLAHKSTLFQRRIFSLLDPSRRRESVGLRRAGLLVMVSIGAGVPLATARVFHVAEGVDPPGQPTLIATVQDLPEVTIDEKHTYELPGRQPVGRQDETNASESVASNTFVTVRSASRPGVYRLADGVTLRLAKRDDENDSSRNSVTILWAAGDNMAAKEHVIHVADLDRGFGIVWARNSEAHHHGSVHRFWIAKANAVTRVLVRSRDDVETENYPWAADVNVRNSTQRQHLRSVNYGGIPATLLTDLKSLRPPQVAVVPPKADLFSDVDFSALPAENWWSAGHELPALHVVDSEDPFRWQRAPDVFGLPVQENTWVQYAFNRNHFYIEYRPDGSWEFQQTYGPIEGNPIERLKLDVHLRQHIASGGSGYRISRMLRSGSEQLARLAAEILAEEIEKGVEQATRPHAPGAYRTFEFMRYARTALTEDEGVISATTMKPQVDRLRMAVASAERVVDELNDRHFDSEYQSVTYLQEKSNYPIPDSLWGNSINGLRLALVPRIQPMADELNVGPGDSLQLELVVENVSDNVIKLMGYVTQEAGRRVIVSGATGDLADINGYFTSTIPLSHRWQLQPGERYVLSMPKLHFTEESPLYGRGVMQQLGWNVQMKPGKHELTCEYSFGRYDNRRHRHVPGETEWIGTLSTGILRLNGR